MAPPSGVKTRKISRAKDSFEGFFAVDGVFAGFMKTGGTGWLVGMGVRGILPRVSRGFDVSNTSFLLGLSKMVGVEDVVG